MPLTDAELSTLNDLLIQALELDPARRIPWTSELPRQYEALKPTLRELLARVDAPETFDFLNTLPRLDRLGGPTTAAHHEGDSVGPYRLVRPLGQGGMGAVWLAERSDGTLKRQVALKMPLLATQPLIRQRLAVERDILAALEHPHIARLYDAGVDTDGQPYLALEYVEGEPIDAYCRSHALSVDARLALFLQVARAVVHAHGKLVLHRDLKPGNILVTADGQARLLDFGIAKLLQADLPGDGALTQVAGRALTPDYAAPEQILGQPMTVASDVYSLGVVLFELLAGQRPYRLAQGSPAALADSIRAVRLRPPSAMAADPKSRRRLTGDLDTIVLKALKAEPAERYSTMSALIDDVERLRDGHPIRARPDSAPYRLRKFVLRNRLPVASAAVVALAVLAGAGSALWQAAQAERERDHALSLARRNASLVEFFDSMLTQAAQDKKPITVPALIQRSRAIAAREGGDSPTTDAAVLMMLAGITVSMGDAASTTQLLTDADARLQAARDAGEPALRALLLCTQAFVASLQGELDQAKVRFAQALPLAAEDPATHAECLLRRAYVAQNHNDAAGALTDAEHALALMRRSGVATPLGEARALANVAYGHHLAGHTAQADAAFAQAIARFRALGRGDIPIVVTFLNNWGIASYAAGDIPRARASYDEAMAIAERLAPDAAPPFYLLRNRAMAELDLAHHDAALADFKRLIATSQDRGDALSAAHGKMGVALTLLDRGDSAEARRITAEMREALGARLAPDSVLGVTSRQFDARADLHDGRLAQAREGFSGVIAFFDARSMQVAPVVNALRGRAEAHLREGSLDAAAVDLDRALTIARRLQGDKPYSSHVGRALAGLQSLQQARGQVDEARRTAVQAAEYLTHALGAEHPETRKALAGVSPTSVP